MVFSSHLFVFYFLPVALVVYYLLPRRVRESRADSVELWVLRVGQPRFHGPDVVLHGGGLLLWSGHRGTAGKADGGNPFGRCGSGEERTPRQRTAVAVSVTTNLSLLGFFKYFNFSVDSFNALAGWLGFADAQLDSVLRVALPLGISFYTFQSMSYTIDVYRGRAKALRNFIDFACYVSLFPQLVAGPIIRFAEIEDQLRDRRETVEKFARGVAFFSLGLAKKVLLANPCGKVADTVFDAGSALPMDAWYGALAYAFQIYFDFSGYTDMAIGLGLMLGFVLPKNFDSPYKADSITDFWRRWHMSLSNWLRDYLYIPLGGSHKGPRRTYINLLLVMLLGGLWHGAAWNFVLWGGFHGVLLALERARGKRSLFEPLPRSLRVAGTFLLVLLSWVIFRSDNLTNAGALLANMVGLGPRGDGSLLLGGVIAQPFYLGTVAVAALVVWRAPQTWDWTRSLPLWRALICLGLLWVSLVALTTQSFNPFIYFIF